MEVVDHVVFVKEYTADLQSFKYAAYLFDVANLASTSLKRIQIDPLTFPSADKRVGLQFNKLLGYDDTTDTLYVVMSNSEYTEIHSKVLGSSGPFDAQIPVLDSTSTITIGNSKLMFDNSVRKFYRFASTGNVYDVLAIKTSSAGTEFGPVIYTDQQNFRLMKDTFVITSSTGSAGSYKASFGIFEQVTMIASGDDSAGTGSFAPVSYYNKYNFIFISENIFSFNRYNSRLLFSTSDITALLTAAELTEAKNDFKGASRVAFNVEKQFILNDKSIIIYELSYNTAGT